jgi:hypothetical protein
VVLQSGILTADIAGRISLRDPKTGTELVEPFEPVLQPDKRFAWKTPALLPGGAGAVIADGDVKLYRLAIQPSPVPHLESEAEADLVEPATSGVAIAGKHAFLVDRRHGLVSFVLPDLSPADSWQLDGPAILGPDTGARHVWIQTDTHRIYCLSADGQLLWDQQFEYGPLAGPPVERAEDVLLSFSSGIVVRCDLANGEEAAKVDVTEPLATGPALRDANSCVVVGVDGTVHLVPVP